MLVLEDLDLRVMKSNPTRTKRHIYYYASKTSKYIFPLWYIVLCYFQSVNKLVIDDVSQDVIVQEQVFKMRNFISTGIE